MQRIFYFSSVSHFFEGGIKIIYYLFPAFFFLFGLVPVYPYQPVIIYKESERKYSRNQSWKCISVRSIVDRYLLWEIVKEADAPWCNLHYRPTDMLPALQHPQSRCLEESMEYPSNY